MPAYVHQVGSAVSQDSHSTAVHVSPHRASMPIQYLTYTELVAMYKAEGHMNEVEASARAQLHVTVCQHLNQCRSSVELDEVQYLVSKAT